MTIHTYHTYMHAYYIDLAGFPVSELTRDRSNKATLVSTLAHHSSTPCSSSHTSLSVRTHQPSYEEHKQRRFVSREIISTSPLLFFAASLFFLCWPKIVPCMYVVCILCGSCPHVLKKIILCAAMTIVHVYQCNIFLVDNRLIVVIQLNGVININSSTTACRR